MEWRMTQYSWQTKSSNEEARRAERLDVTIKASLREHGTTKFEVKVIDLSTTGFRCETSFTLHPDTRVWLTIPGMGALEAIVAWRNRYLYGFTFEKSLHPAVWQHISDRFGAMQKDQQNVVSH
jgi:PilZ domain